MHSKYINDVNLVDLKDSFDVGVVRKESRKISRFWLEQQDGW